MKAAGGGENQRRASKSGGGGNHMKVKSHLRNSGAAAKLAA